MTSHNCGEARDSATLRLPGAQETLVKAIAALEKPFILVLIGGRIFGIEDIYNKAAAIIEAWPAGEEGGNAVADVILEIITRRGAFLSAFPEGWDRYLSIIIINVEAAEACPMEAIRICLVRRCLLLGMD